MEGGLNCELASDAAREEAPKGQKASAASEAKPGEFAPGAAKAEMPKGQTFRAASGA
jgi:hypothetical protein